MAKRSPRNRRICVLVTSAEFIALKQLAERDGVSRSDVLRTPIRDFLQPPLSGGPKREA